MSFNTPSGVAVATEHNWIGSNAAYNMLKPQNDPKEAKVWGTQDMTGFIELLGGKNFVAGVQYRHFEEDRLHATVIAAGAGAAASATATLTVDATDYMAAYPATAVAPYVATGTQVNLMPVRVNEILEFPGGAQGVVTSVTPAGPTFTVVSTNGIAIPATTNADNIINLGVSVGEGKDMPTSYNFREGVYENTTETMEDAHSSTGRSMGEQTWVDFEWQGKKEAVWYFKGQSGTFKRFRNFRELKLVAGEKVVSATAINAYDATLTRTEGLIPFASSYNNTNTFNLASGLTLEDYQNIIIDQLDKNGGESEYANWTSISNRAVIESFVRDNMKNGAVQYGAFSGGQKQAVDFGFDSFQNLGYTTHLMTYQPFNNPTVLGANGHKYQNLSILIPTSKQIYALGDKKEKTEVPTMRINYMKLGNYSREWEEFLTGGANGVYTNTVDKMQINFRSEVGFEGFGSNRFATLQGVNS